MRVNTYKKISTLLLALGISLSAAGADAPQRSVHDLKAREIYAKVISIPTQLGSGKVPEMVEYLAGEFRAAGFPEKDVTILPFKGPGDATASLVVRYRSDGKAGKGRAKPIVLLAH